ncbi:MAG TPA: hypothetical protein ENJ50_10335 [Planctomycetaceae bacterium]|nr:hypothetical protein [Planctomycetaceae bacterium]
MSITGTTKCGAGILAALCLLVGCSRYQIGPANLYRPEIRTVYVPMFESDSLRQGLAEWLTEAVVKQIEAKTPYKVVHTPQTDSVLTGRILSDRKQVLIESANDDARNIGFTEVVLVTWSARNGELLMQRRIEVASHFFPESGQSLTTAQQQVVEDLADQIVNAMEAPQW